MCIPAEGLDKEELLLLCCTSYFT